MNRRAVKHLYRSLGHGSVRGGIYVDINRFKNIGSFVSAVFGIETAENLVDVRRRVACVEILIGIERF